PNLRHVNVRRDFGPSKGHRESPELLPVHESERGARLRMLQPVLICRRTIARRTSGRVLAVEPARAPSTGPADNRHNAGMATRVAPRMAASTARHAPKRRRLRVDPAKAWARRLARTRPGLVEYVLDGLGGIYGRPEWQ